MVRILFLPSISKNAPIVVHSVRFLYFPHFPLLKLVYGEIAKKSQVDFVKKARILPDGQIVFTSPHSHVILLNE